MGGREGRGEDVERGGGRGGGGGGDGAHEAQAEARGWVGGWVGEEAEAVFEEKGGWVGGCLFSSFLVGRGGGEGRRRKAEADEGAVEDAEGFMGRDIFVEEEEGEEVGGDLVGNLEWVGGLVGGWVGK